MDVRRWFERASLVWRIKVYVEELEERVDELPEEYDAVKQELEDDLKGYSTTVGFFYAISLIFYASIVTSVTASFGLELQVFQQMYSILGFSTVGAGYIAVWYLRRLAWLDLENSRVRVISYLTQEEFGNDLH